MTNNAVSPKPNRRAAVAVILLVAILLIVSVSLCLGTYVIGKISDNRAERFMEENEPKVRELLQDWCIEKFGEECRELRLEEWIEQPVKIYRSDPEDTSHVVCAQYDLSYKWSEDVWRRDTTMIEAGIEEDGTAYVRTTRNGDYGGVLVPYIFVDTVCTAR